ncbi:hypothetical protein W97_05913 [Coniosporium apollinis CBS 100218]|uniref:Autophagy protein 5 n=1 Tax=Coniosporium apollinis (strain CBS 100218) TaxID=1168221 RepID=R7YXP6_CONA1|nr:uncharacterized protein W97_05913 [Coniosporium apollinis CBS 100218]EON66667.1 hypothetical protein W97_05913 [Coniosporium apollinis CBS 100218]
MTTSANDLSSLQRKIWDGSIPLEIRLASAECRTFDQSDPYLIQFPRISYLPFLLPRLHAFFSPSLINPDVSPSDGWLSYEDVALKWHYPLGLLYDLYSGAEPAHQPGRTNQPGALPWKLVVHFTEWPDEQLIRLDAEGKILHDAFINSVKEADFLRNGSAKAIMSLKVEESMALWQAVETHDLALFNSVNQKLLNPPGVPLRHIPIKIYLPSSSATASTTSDTTAIAPGHLKVVQSLATPKLPSRQPQTLGTALNAVLPTVFVSRRNAILAQPVLHGAVVPLSANLEELGKAAAYADGFLHLAVVVMG